MKPTLEISPFGPANADLAASGKYKSFISVRDEEAHLAIALSRIVDSFPALAPCFVAKTAIIAGELWLENVKSALSTSRLIVVLFNREALSHHWLHLEAGAALARGVPLIAVAFGGLRSSELPEPYRHYQSVDLNALAGADQFLSAMQRHSPPPPSRHISSGDLLSIFNT